MKLIYIAGPYRHREGDPTVEQNILAARRKGLEVVKAGLDMFPIIPHMATANMELDAPEVDDQYFLDGTMQLLRKCDAVLLVSPDAPEKSVGTKHEVRQAHILGMSVFWKIEELIHWYYMQGIGDQHDYESTPSGPPV